MRSIDYAVWYCIASYIVAGLFGAFVRSKAARAVTSSFAIFLIAPLWPILLAWWGLVVAINAVLSRFARLCGVTPPEFPKLRELLSFVVDR